MTQRAFADQHGLGLSTLQKWLTQAQSAKTAAPMQWQEVKLPSALGTSCWAAEIVQPNGVTLRFSHDASAELVSTLWPLSSC